MLLTDKYVDKNYGIITCDDRIISCLGTNNSIYSLCRLFMIKKTANYRYLEFISSFDDYNCGNENLTKITDSVVKKGRSYDRLNFLQSVTCMCLR